MKKIKKWEVLNPDMISSDETDADDKGKSIFSVKILPCRRDRVNSFFLNLDDSVVSRRSDQAARQNKARIRNRKVSSRSPPKNIPKWAIK